MHVEMSRGRNMNIKELLNFVIQKPDLQCYQMQLLDYQTLNF